MLKIADAVEKDAEGFAALEALNCGKPYHAVLNDEMPAIIDCYRYFAGAVRNMQGPLAAEYIPGHTSMIDQRLSPGASSISRKGSELCRARWSAFRNGI